MYNQSHDCWCITVSQRLRPFIAVNRSYASSSSPRSETLVLSSINYSSLFRAVSYILSGGQVLVVYTSQIHQIVIYAL